MNILKRVMVVVSSLALLACGGGGGSEGTSPFGGGSSSGGSTAPNATAASVDVMASSVDVGSGGDQVTITATVKNSGNVSLAAAPVVFSSDTGTLTSAAKVTDANGVATVVLTAGANKSNRDVNVTVTSGGVSGKIVLPVVGTTLTYTGVTTVNLAGAAEVGVKAEDSKHNPIAGLPVAISSSLNNGLAAATASTNSQGLAKVNYVATNAGSDTLTFNGANVQATQKIEVSGENFSFVDPVAGTEVVVGQSLPLTVQYLSGGVPQVGKTILFTSTAGTISTLNSTTASAVTDANGKAVAFVTSSTASPAIVQATLSVTGISALATVPIEFIAETPSKVVLQVSPSSVGPNPAGGKTQQLQLIAAVTDAVGNPVKNASVNFNRVIDPSGGSLSQATALTDSSGLASVQFIPGPLSTASNGVQVRATVSGTSVSGDAFLTVSQGALSIAFGTGNTIQNIDAQTYKKDWVLYVQDSAGVSVPNVKISVKVLPVEYGKGVLVWSGKVWVKASSAVTCANEDVNYNGVLDSGEDTSRNGILDPGNVISVSTNGGLSSSASGTITTDSSGRATVSVIYAESYAPWVRVRLIAQAVVSGTESRNQPLFWVDPSTEDFSSETVPPAGQESPFGTSACTAPG